MYNLKGFRERVQELYRRASPYDDRRPNQGDLADAVGLNRTELSNRLNGTKGAHLSNRDVKAIVRTLAEWGALHSQSDAIELLEMVGCPPFTAAEMAAPPFDTLVPLAIAAEPARVSARVMVEPQSNLPAALTSFVGHEHEIAECEALLAGSRLLTLTGAGGCGKTRLALEVAGRLVSRFPAGVWLVEMARLTDGALVATAIAQVLGVREQIGQPTVESLIAALRQSEALIILDNCEHLVQAAAELAQQLLTACPQLRILATSRELLRTRGEVTLRVPSLTVPGAQVETTPNVIARYEAVRLFIDRAQAVVPSFRLGLDNAQAVRDICARLDGLPLAIELAAARVRVMPAEEISVRLNDRFRLLTAGDRAALPRQQTLRALVDWSYDLLDEEERRVFRCLAVFAGGFTLAAAEAVCGGEGRAATEVADVVLSLVDKSLVVAEVQAEETRYHLLDTIRQYASEKLGLDAVESRVASANHQSYYLHLAEQAAPRLLGPQQTIWLSRLELEHDNLRAAIGAGESDDDEDGSEVVLRLCVALGRFWAIRGYLSEGRHLLEAALRRASTVATPLRAEALYVAGNLAADHDDYARARELLEECITLTRQLGQTQQTAYALDSLGRLALYQDDYAAARTLLEESLSLYQQHGKTGEMATTLAHLGRVAHYQGDYAAASQLFEQALALDREVGNSIMYATVLYDRGELRQDMGNYSQAKADFEASLSLSAQLGYNSMAPRLQYLLGRIAQHDGELEKAEALYEQSLSQSRKMDNRADIALALSGLAAIKQEQGDWAAAIGLEQDSLRLSWAMGYRRDIAQTLEALASLALAGSQPQRAATLLGAAERLRQTLGAPLPPALQPAYEQILDRLRHELATDALEQSWQAGSVMDVAEMVGYALM